MNQSNDTNSPQDQLLSQLAARAVTGELTAAEHQQLHALLLKSPEARRDYLLLLDIEYGLRQISADHEQSEAGVPPSRGPFMQDLVSQSGLSLSPTASGNGKFRRLTLGLAISISIAGLITFLSWRNGRGPDELAIVDPPADGVSQVVEVRPEMTLVQSARARFFGEPTTLSAGEVLALDHDYALVEGSIQLRSRLGAEMIIPAPAVFLVHSADRVSLKVGSCSVYAPDGAEGFRVITPQAEVIDKGTRFRVNVSESGRSNVEVIEGAAEVLSLSEPNALPPAGLMLSAGEGRVIDSHGTILPRKLGPIGRYYQSSLPDRVVKYSVSSLDDEVPDRLLDVTVQRGGRRFKYDADKLIGFDLIHFKAASNSSNLSTPLNVRDARDGDGTRARGERLDRGTLLSAGILNPGGSVQPLTSDPDWTHEDPAQRTPGFAIRFHQPIINSEGPDIVFFDLQVIHHPEAGDAFHVSPIRFSSGLRSHTITKYDISLADSSAKRLSGFLLYRFHPAIKSLQQLSTAKHDGGHPHAVPAKVIAVGIDLSDLGYPPGAKVQELFFQDVLDDENLVDPVFIGGLPPTS